MPTAADLPDNVLVSQLTELLTGDQPRLEASREFVAMIDPTRIQLRGLAEQILRAYARATDARPPGLASPWASAGLPGRLWKLVPHGGAPS